MDIRDEQRAVFGGFNTSASFFGWLVAVAIATILTAFWSAVGIATVLSRTMPVTYGRLQFIGWAGAILWLVTLTVAYYAGGYVAGRMARFDSGRQGFGVWVMGIVATVVLFILAAIFGASFNALAQMNLPRIPISAAALSVGGLITLVVGLVVSLLAAIAGSGLGERYHERIDRVGGHRTESYKTLPQQPGRYTDPSPSFGERIEHKDNRNNQ